MPFKPGQSGNPKGAPKRGCSLAMLVREKTDGGGLVLDVVLRILLDEAAANKDRLRAAEILLDRGHGRPLQTVEIDAKTEVVDSRAVSSAERGARVRALLEAAGVAVTEKADAPPAD